MLGLVGIGGAYRNLLHLMGTTRPSQTWWDVSETAGLEGTYQALYNLVGHSRICRTRWDVPGQAGTCRTWWDTPRLWDLMEYAPFLLL